MVSGERREGPWTGHAVQACMTAHCSVISDIKRCWVGLKTIGKSSYVPYSTYARL